VDRQALVEDAWRQAGEAAARSGVDVRPLVSIDEIVTLDRVFASAWGSPGHAIAPIELTRALQHAGNYVVGAFAGDRMVGGSLGFFGFDGGKPLLHSHVTGVLPELRSRSIGYAIKVDQRAWALAAGIDEVVWTFDPLVRRNAYLNLTKLGAEVVGFEPSFYGDALHDDINAGDESDRAVVRWPVARESVAATLERSGSGEPAATARPAGTVILDEAPEPRASPPDPSAPGPLIAWVPPDIVAIRRSDPRLSLAWRHAVRATVGSAIAAGHVAVAMSRDGWYRLERRST
jgi:predicted GNAT superfamily acetyltransferase